MELLHSIFGVGKGLTTAQMAVRAVVSFILTLLMIRIAGMAI